MKKQILAFVVLTSLVLGFNTQIIAQNSEQSNCYFEWAKVFEKRGANDVEDGTYDDVIITIRNGSEAECFNGKCDVLNGKITTMYVRLEDGAFEPLKRKARFDIPITINNGMSTVLLTMEDDIINVLFIKKIKPKKASFQKAAGPGDY